MDRIVPPLADIRASDLAAYRVAELGADEVEHDWTEPELEPWWALAPVAILALIGLGLMWLGIITKPQPVVISLSTPTEVARGIGHDPHWREVDAR